MPLARPDCQKPNFGSTERRHLLERIQQQTLREAADAFTKQATQPPVTLTEAQQSILDQVMVDVPSTTFTPLGSGGSPGSAKPS